jgi:hypothetical protein
MDPPELQRIAARRYEDFLEDLRAMGNVDCGSYAPEGVNEIADLCQARFEAGPGIVNALETRQILRRNSHRL